MERLEREVLIERPVQRFEGMRVAWSGVWAGVLLVLGTLVFLTTLGLALGVTAGERNVDVITLGVAAVVWSALSLLFSVFLGGIAATRTAMVWEPVAGLLQGALVWVISLVAVVYLATHGVDIMGGSALRILAEATTGLKHGAASTAWTQFVAVALSLLAALSGAALGRRGAALRGIAARSAARTEMERELAARTDAAKPPTEAARGEPIDRSPAPP